MQRLLAPIILVALALAVPIVPFLVFGPELEARLERSVHGAVDPAVAAVLVIGLLGTDVLLPIPSSVLSTLGGEVLGFFAGTTASFLGLTLGAAIGFALARWVGRPLLVRMTAAEDAQRIDRLSDRLGPAVLIVTRPLPVLAEATVLFLGATKLTWRRFLPPVIVTNLTIAAAYTALGRWVHLPTALMLSIALPLAATWIARRVISRQETLRRDR